MGLRPATALQLVWGVAIGGALLAFQQGYTVRVSFSESLPEVVFLVTKGAEFQKGDAVLFHPPRNPVFEADFVKLVVGVAGDLVEHRDGHVFVGGRDIGPLQAMTKTGRPLAPGAVGTIPEGFVFVAGTHERSYDSRYKEIGLVPLSAIVGRADPLL